MSHARVLRLAVVYQGRLLTERLVRERAAVTLGWGPGCVLEVPQAPGMPHRLPVLTPHRAGYRLELPPGAAARLSRGPIIECLDPDPAPRTTLIDVHDRGKVTLGGLTLLFQFVEAPAVMAKATLPLATRGRLSTLFDPAYLAIAVAVGLAGGVAGGSLDVWWRLTGQYLEENLEGRRRGVYEALRTDTIRVHQPAPTRPAEPARAPEAEPTALPAPSRVPAEAPTLAQAPRPTTSTATPARTSPRRPTARESVHRRTFLHVLQSTDGTGPGAATTLSQGLGREQLARAFEDTSVGVEVADATRPRVGFESEPEIRMPVAYQRLDPLAPPRISVHRPAIATPGKDPEAQVRIRTDVTGTTTGLPPTTPPDVAEDIAGVFRRRAGALKHCYEQLIRRQGATDGRLKMRFTLGSGGRVTAGSVVQNGFGQSDLPACIVEKVMSWRFPVPAAGPLAFQHTFVFAAK